MPEPEWLGKTELIEALQEMSDKPVKFSDCGDKLMIPIIRGNTEYVVTIERKKDIEDA